ncbi:MAG: bifunctional diaminohydroxyphosphoribosylaminopyrimidine deaminase/5-amino-6-(5-phosphoribosylamino)uracil reductase RibD [Bacillota bacterium]
MRLPKALLREPFFWGVRSLATDGDFMQQAILLAERARGRTSPNPLVGAVVVSQQGQVIGRGYHARAGGPHAEVVALRQAGELARGATLFVTLEPCCHYGRTPPCTEAIIAAGIRRVVIAALDPNPNMAGKGVQILRENGIKVETGLLELPAKQQNEVFRKYITTKRPFVIAKWAMSLDGKIATASGESKWITGPRARAWGHRLRDEVDAILVGVGTVLADDPQLTTRLPSGGRNPLRIVLDSRARTPAGARVLQAEPGAVIAVTEAADHEHVRQLRRAGAKVVQLPAGKEGIAWPALLDLLGTWEVSSLLIEGGSRVLGSAWGAGIIDKVICFMAPSVIGGESAPGPVGGAGSDRLDAAARLTNLRVERAGADLVIIGYPIGGRSCSQG